MPEVPGERALAQALERLVAARPQRTPSPRAVALQAAAPQPVAAQAPVPLVPPPPTETARLRELVRELDGALAAYLRTSRSAGVR